MFEKRCTQLLLAIALLAGQPGCAFVASKVVGTSGREHYPARPSESDAKLKCDGAPCAAAGLTADSTRAHNPYVLWGGIGLEVLGGALLVGATGPIQDGKNAALIGGGVMVILAALGEAYFGWDAETSLKVDCCSFDQQTVASLHGDRVLLHKSDLVGADGSPLAEFSVAAAVARHKAAPKEFPAPPPDAAEAQGRLKGGSRLAVLEFKSGARELRTEDIRFYSDVVRGVAVKLQPALDVMTRENLLVLLQASGRSLSDCEGSCQVETGRKLGADAVVSGELSHSDKLYKLSLLLHETASGNLIGTSNASGGTLAELEASVAQASLELLATP